MIYGEDALMDCICDDQLREIKSIKGTRALEHMAAHGTRVAQLHGIRAFLEPQVGLGEGAMGLPDLSSTVGQKRCLGCTAVDWVFLQLSGYPGPLSSHRCRGQCPRAGVSSPIGEDAPLLLDFNHFQHTVDFTTGSLLIECISSN